ncbi:MAG: co-chaperone GroES [Candidatus Dependentiae bacterium]|nr:co-chaperone GroES [Candidatus Dependentiae bacterium]
MFEKFRPLADRVLVKRLEGEEKTAGGIFIPEAAKEKAQTGKIIAVGCGRKDTAGNCIPMDVKVDDIIYFGKYAGTETDRNHLIIREDEILGVVER